MKRQPKTDEGLQDINEWHRCFVAGHTQRLTDLNLPPEQFDAQLAEVMRVAAAVSDRMKSDYLARRA